MSTQMTDYLVDVARRQIWCNPRQDNQSTWKPQRITSGDGAQKFAYVLGRQLDLPWPKKRAHVFQVGQISPALLGLLETNPSWQKETWFNVAETMNTLPLYMNIYNEDGVNIPRKEVYYMYTKEKCLIFAVEVDTRLKMDLSKDNIYFRMYTSAYLQRNNPPVTQPEIYVASYEVTQFNDINGIRAAYLASKARPGHTEAFVNGFMVGDLNVQNVKVGDVVEWIYEASVKRMVTWTVRDLKNFNSTMDEKYKFILHYPKAEVADQIDFDDDIDLYIQYVLPNGNTQAFYYVKNQPDAMRMLTHRDYSIVGDYVEFTSRALAKALGLVIPDLLEFQVVAKIREGGYDRPLVKESSDIFELYKLSDTRILMAMSGIDNMVPIWNAAALEAAAYPRLMRMFYDDVNIEVTEEAYGYNSISQILADTPQKTHMVGDFPVVDLPYELSVDSTCYEYDSLGKLLSYHYHENDDTYEARNSSCRLVESLVGKGSAQTSVTFDRNHFVLPAKADWRLYETQMDPSLPGVWYGGWTDITGDTTKYKVENGELTWIAPESGQYLMLRTNETFLAYDFEIEQSEGTLLFALSEFLTIEGVTALHNMPVPMGDLQIFMNGYNLVQGIDYVIKFPNVSVNAQRYYAQGATPSDPVMQQFHVRFTGFCDSDLQMWKPRDTGFVINGVLSENRRYDVMDDKVLHISVFGGVMAKEDVKFFENHPDFNPVSPMNGRPYQIKRTIVPLKDFTKSGTYPLLAIARETDTMVEAYMQLYWDKPTDIPVSAATERWNLTSPFLSKLVALCVENRLTWEATKLFSDQEVIEICKPYEVLLEYDPLGEGNELPDAYVNIMPTRYDQTVNVQRVQNRFLEAAGRIYGKGKVVMRNYITFSL